MQDQFADQRSDRSVFNETNTKPKFTHKSGGAQELQPLIGNQHSSMNARDEATAAAYKMYGDSYLFLYFAYCSCHV